MCLKKKKQLNISHREEVGQPLGAFPHSRKERKFDFHVPMDCGNLMNFPVNSSRLLGNTMLITSAFSNWALSHQWRNYGLCIDFHKESVHGCHWHLWTLHPEFLFPHSLFPSLALWSQFSPTFAMWALLFCFCSAGNISSPQVLLLEPHPQTQLFLEKERKFLSWIRIHPACITASQVSQLLF